MLFNSLSFLIFFPLVVIGYYLLPHRFRWAFLLAASCLFYMAFVPAYILILFLTILVDYIAGIRIEQSTGSMRRVYLIGSIIVTCVILFVFKYFNFFNDSFGSLAQLVGWSYPIHAVNLLLPIGLSFHTFQSLSYVIEVYRGHQRAERHFGIYALYVMFFPQLVAGPIERPQHLLDQFHAEHRFDPARVSLGLKIMAWGFFHKVMIADRLAIGVNHVYADPTQVSGLSLAFATIAFAIQIFCDFAGYSLIALGAAEVLGIRLMQNFDRPYFATSISDFWRRWHISLSSWFRDYVYIPLGGNRVGRWKQYRNILIVFLLSGLWHGANWTYVVWGMIHGIAIILSHASMSLRGRMVHLIGLDRLPRFHQLVQIIITFILVCLAWVFFRASSISESLTILQHIGGGLGDILYPARIWDAFRQLGLMRKELVYVAAAIGLLGVVHMWETRGENIVSILSRQPLIIRFAVYIGLIIGMLYLGEYQGAHQFIYFQF